MSTAHRIRASFSCIRASFSCALLLGALAPALLSAACFVDGTADPVAARITLALGGVTKGGLVAPDETIDLDERPCYVAATVSAEDLAAPVRAAWACDPGDTPGGTAELSLEVPAGDERELQVVVFLMEPEGLVTLTDFRREDWSSGVVDLDITPTEAATGQVDGFITGTDRDVVAVRLVDNETGVRLPPVATTASGGGFHFTADRVPRGRFFRLELELTDGETHEVTDCAVWATEGSVTVVDVDVAADRC